MDQSSGSETKTLPNRSIPLIEERDKQKRSEVLRRMKPWIGQCECSRHGPPSPKETGEGRTLQQVDTWPRR